MKTHALLDQLTDKQKADLKAILLSDGKTTLSDALAGNSSNKNKCPHCSHLKFIKIGKTRNVQRYKCKRCNKTFGLNTNTFIHKTHKPLSTWDRYIQLMNAAFPISYIAKELRISTRTVFYWRHKILNALKQIGSPQLNGIVEVDETFFRLSYKGQKQGLPRKARKRGGQAKKRGISKEQVCVLTAIDRNKNNWMKSVCLGRISTQNLEDDFIGKVTADSVLVTDKHSSYTRFCKDQGLQHESAHASSLRRGAYHLQNVNSLHSQIKRFMKRFNGVATKYLDNYLVYWQWRNRDVVLALANEHAVVSYKALANSRMMLK